MWEMSEQYKICELKVQLKGRTQLGEIYKYYMLML